MGIAQHVVGTGMGIAGALMSSGSKPEIPAVTRIDTTESAKKTIGGNQQNLNEAQNLASDVNLFNQSQLQQMLASAIPGYESIVSTMSGNLQSQLRGELPPDVVEAISRGNAQLAQQGGFSGSQAQGYRTSRDLGLTSLSMINNAMDSASRYIAQARQTSVAPQFDVSAMFISPAQRLQQENINREMEFQRNLLAAGVAAAPNPKKAAVGQFLISTGAGLQEAGNQNMGGGFGGGMGGMMGG